MGTPNYISPEQARGEGNVDTRADIYSLGATFYHMLTGQVPFPLENAMEVVSRHMTEDPPTPHEIEPRVSREADFIVMKMMSKDRDARYQTPTELVTDLESLIAGGKPVEMLVREAEAEAEAAAARPPAASGTPPTRAHRLSGSSSHKYLARKRRFKR